MATSSKDPLEKIAELMDQKIKEAFEGRERTEREAKDPAARIEGMIDRAVGRHFEAFRKGLEEESSSSKGKGGDDDDDEGDGGILKGIFGK